MMWDEMTAKVKDNPGMEVACCIFYDFDNKEYIGGKFIYGTNGQVKIDDYTPLGNGFTDNIHHTRLVTVVHIHPSLTHDEGNNVRPIGPSDDDFKAVSKKNMNLVLSLIIKEKKKIIIENPKKVRLQTYTSKTRKVRKLAI